MKASITAFGSGLLFALGLALAGMMQPSKVAGFLDFFGAWDASLAFVMGGAATVMAGAVWLARRRREALFGGPIQLSGPAPIDGKLVLGTALFGVGWGLSGFCPGPALASVGALSHASLVFIPFLLVGTALYQVLVTRVMLSRDAEPTVVDTGSRGNQAAAVTSLNACQ